MFLEIVYSPPHVFLPALIALPWAPLRSFQSKDREIDKWMRGKGAQMIPEHLPQYLFLGNPEKDAGK